MLRRIFAIMLFIAMTVVAASASPKSKLQTSLDDFYVSYQINAYTEMPLVRVSRADAE